MIRYKDLKEAQAKPAAKKKASAGKSKGNGSHKCKSPTMEAQAEASFLGMKTNAPKPRDKVRQLSKAVEQATWRISVAQMY